VTSATDRCVTALYYLVRTTPVTLGLLAAAIAAPVLTAATGAPYVLMFAAAWAAAAALVEQRLLAAFLAMVRIGRERGLPTPFDLPTEPPRP